MAMLGTLSRIWKDLNWDWGNKSKIRCYSTNSIKYKQYIDYRYLWTDINEKKKILKFKGKAGTIIM
ncbi:hypothetical protein DERF_007289 [Dermatophagoides farinae]|uniref:Uncharacterized protein n=1 Tax=Dermatophagoides farinae TaxID=6954 RepID=A0A922L5V1_DERFA|nr:hypothetical protein DERF_007289 [Dermatophagoides farinae]